MTRIYAYGAVVVVALSLGLMAVVVILNRSDDRFSSCRTSRVASGKASIGGPFTLVDHNGNTVTDRDVITKPALIYFGYTFCPDVCPLDTARNAEAVDLLAEQGIDVIPVFITIDPARDTPAELADYVAYTHEKMIGLTGSAAQVKAASKAYKTYYRKASDDEHYLMEHSTFTYLVLPEQGFVEFFRRDLKPHVLAESVACFVGAS